jgi:hypothetical protein
VVNLTRELRLEYARQGIRVNALCHGFYQRGPDRGGRREKGPALFLASAASDYMAAQTLVTDGGCRQITGHLIPRDSHAAPIPEDRIRRQHVIPDDESRCPPYSCILRRPSTVPPRSRANHAAGAEAQAVQFPIEYECLFVL